MLFNALPVELHMADTHNDQKCQKANECPEKNNNLSRHCHISEKEADCPVQENGKQIF